MKTFHPTHQLRNYPLPGPHVAHRLGSLLGIVAFLVISASGCASSSSLGLNTHFDKEPNAAAVLKGKFASPPQDRLPAGMAVVFNTDSVYSPLGLTEDTWPQFAARVKQQVQGQVPVSMKEVIRLDGIPSGEAFRHLKALGEQQQVDVVLVVLSSSQEVQGPAQFNVLPEVGTLNGHQIENHASVELGLLDLHSGKLLLRSQGNSYATLEKLDVPLDSNQYPRVRGSAMTSPIYPEEDNAFETLRMVALQEALEQAVHYFHLAWRDTAGLPATKISEGGGSDA